MCRHILSLSCVAICLVPLRLRASHYACDHFYFRVPYSDMRFTRFPVVQSNHMYPIQSVQLYILSTAKFQPEIDCVLDPIPIDTYFQYLGKR
ncbi:hypothetical protein C8R41DRAFT_309764 [Lentinula lateritia]|uniref:Secreted protein n=1 Tax=Lentinula lateritia TaxID=40482 RepID=A0ABQ8VH40_9AGAR|nr:hypothetical protein C8R41DRAFT_309764 [Lentinula lateritia]